MKNWYVNTPFFVGSCSSNPQPFQKSSGSPEVGACFFLGQMAHNQIYQIARNILPTKGEYICQNKLHLLDIYQYHHHHHYKNGIPNRSPTTARLQPHKWSLQEYDTRSHLFFETQKKQILETWWAQPQFLQRGDFPTIFLVYDPSFSTIFMPFWGL